MVSPSDAKYTGEQRAAFALHYQPGVCTSVQVAELAKAGKLTGSDGKRLAAFDANPNSIRVIAGRVRRGRDVDGMDPATRRRLFARLAREARREASAAKGAKQALAAARALDEIEMRRAAAENLPVARETQRDAILASLVGPRPGDRVVARPAPEPPGGGHNSVVTPQSEAVEVRSPGERIGAEVRKRLLAIAAPAPSISAAAPTGLGHGDETLQSRSDPVPRDRPLEPVAQPRRRAVSGTLDYGPRTFGF